MNNQTSFINVSKKMPSPYARVLAVWQSKSSVFRFVTESFTNVSNEWHSVSKDLNVTDDLYVTYWMDVPALPE